MTIDGYLVRLQGLHSNLAETIGNPNRVWCRTCGRSQAVDAVKCISCGWPKCCGYTMTIDELETDG